MRFQSIKPSAISREQFQETFGAVFENAPWVASEAWEIGIDESHDSIESLHSLMEQVIRAASKQKQQALVAGHPKLATKLPDEESYATSRNEQAKAGLSSLDENGAARFAKLNAAYEDKFGWPFILAVEGLDSDTIMSEFERRLGNDDHEQESTAALDQVIRIGLLRLRKL